MTEEAPSVWTLDRSAIEDTLVAGRSARREYSALDIAAIRQVLDRPDFDLLSEAERSEAFSQAAAQLSLAEDPVSALGAPGAPLTGIGWLLMVVSAAELLFTYFGYPTSIHSDMDYIGSSFIPARDTINIGLLQNQLMLFHLGLVGLLSGFVSLALRMVVNAVVRRDRT